MGEQDQLRAMRLDQLRADIRKGLDSGPGERWDREALEREARARRSSAKSNAKA